MLLRLSLPPSLLSILPRLLSFFFLPSLSVKYSLPSLSLSLTCRIVSSTPSASSAARHALSSCLFPRAIEVARRRSERREECGDAHSTCGDVITSQFLPHQFGHCHHACGLSLLYCASVKEAVVIASGAIDRASACSGLVRACVRVFIRLPALTFSPATCQKRDIKGVLAWAPPHCGTAHYPLGTLSRFSLPLTLLFCKETIAGNLPSLLFPRNFNSSSSVA